MPLKSLSDLIGQLSVKTVLKKSLFNTTEAAIPNFPGNLAKFPLTTSSRHASICYRSAIALKLAASEPSKAKAIANQFIEVTKGWEDVKFFPEVPKAITNTPQGRLQADAQGWITLTLSEAGIAAWLQGLNDFPLARELEQIGSVGSPQMDRLRSLPLCSRLQLSLPLLLQFGHVRCCAWLRYRDETDHRVSSDQRGVDDEGDDQSLAWRELPATQWGWSDKSPSACYQLLQAIVQAVDTMADQSGEPTTCLRQGYVLVEAIYAFQSAIPLGTIYDLPAEIQVSIWSLTRAAQQVLMLVIVGVLQQTPAQSF
ncbi:MAG: hypothetical protein F6K42_26225 [Leptolyngbya sp. SIO1D8]|nr:hypothetical protein [Leptolyngbya sp. SIO1D8]